ncbi:helix-turn-helix domain-containing protein [Lysinibacillus sphaericus]|uniref:helix-turn-helix domain-containing protein n=1 Tax=Lysinibacillus sphaericus TaxID=1421 RepID=UPI001E4BBEB9|nr:helix-turn-helix domain-containing protein [Lysinibacillus sphaericus]UDK96129.1 helix-turn-helix domain-containing protein [Lysinibacillus sphaericus]
MRNKAEVLMHPVRMKILQALMHNTDEGLSTLEMISVIKDVPQATLYRHIQILMDESIIKIVKERKVRSVTEKFYALNEDAAKISKEDWSILTKKQKLNYISYYQLALLSQYQNYLNLCEEDEHIVDSATFSLLDLSLTKEQFNHFQNDLNDLLTKYYNMSDSSHTTETKTIAVNIIPKS